MRLAGPALALLVALPGLAGATPARKAARPSHRGHEVVSFEALPVDTLNAAIAAAAAAGQAWVRDPIQIALHEANLPPDAVAERTDFTLTWKGNSVENPTAGEVVTVEEGLKDDSVAGEWTRFRLARQPDGSWRLTALHVASRCGRGPAAGMRAFHREPCP
jgi:hypothetical protein